MAKAAKRDAGDVSRSRKKPKREPSAAPTASLSSSSSADLDADEYAESEAAASESEAASDEDASTRGDDSDAIDQDTDEEVKPAAPKKKRKTPSPAKAKGGSPSKSSPKSAGGSYKVADLVPAPKRTAPRGQLSQSTFDFLAGLAKENEREWLQRHDAPYRHALNEWKAFVDQLSEDMAAADWTLPVLPAKDLVKRLARDIRFSPDKTPYKTSFQASFSRTGRKGPYAGYFCMVEPGGKSLIAGGCWCPDKNELATIRTNILRKPKRLRRVISERRFVELFGEPVAKKGQRSNIFGREDELKNAPKLAGVTKDHEHIDLLKCKSFAVAKTLTDAEMRAPDATKKIAEIVAVIAPLVQLLNEYIMPTNADSDSGDDSDAQNEGSEVEA